jgi:TalC/MipB family fructose-6-phosphate aldolase
MRIFLDTADVVQIAKAYDTGLIDGVTTNPTLVARSGKKYDQVIKEIASEFPDLVSISAEVVADTVEDMLTQAYDLHKISNNVTIKVPCTIDGLKVCRQLSKEQITTNVTLIFSAAQSVLAAKAGATYVSPFVGRLDDNSFSGMDLVSGIANVYRIHGCPTMVLAASIRNAHQVSTAFHEGAQVATIPPNVFWEMYKHVLTDKGLEIFQKDWESINSTTN